MKSAKLLAASVVASLALVAGACTAPGGGGGGGAGLPDFRFTANKVTVVEHNDTFLYGQRDEVFAVNLWFRVKVGKANSAQVGVVGNRSQAFDDLGNGESHAFTPAQQATANFNNVELLDVVDLLNPSKNLEIVGTWTWAMEADDAAVDGLMANIMDKVRNALNMIVANGDVPEDPNQLVAALLGDFGSAFNLVAGALFSSIPGVPDDAVGSRFYIGVGAKGLLSNAVDAAVPNNVFPSVAIPTVSVPPDIEGGQIFSLGHNNSFTGEVFQSGDGRHDYDVSMVNVATLPKAPTASFIASDTSGSPGLTVNFDSAGSTDPDGTIVSRNWNFGDFTTGSGVAPSHTFTTAGTFPVTLTVTDNSGMSHSMTTNIAIGGAPTVAPTGLTKTGSGSIPAPPYGDFAWNMVPGATDYEIYLSDVAWQGCATSHGGVISGQVSSGRVQAWGLCQGTEYDVTIRAKANGQWGPWSSAVRITL